MTRRPVALAVAAVVAVLAVSAPVTLARFTATQTASASFTAGSLNPPTGVAGAGGSAASLTWTPSTSTTATGYLLLRSATSGSGYTQVGTVTPVSAAATTDAPGSGTWYYVLDTYFSSWTSAHSNQATVVVGSSVTTTLKGCANNTPITVNAGKNNGYESNPGNACAKDGSVAQDVNSGTNAVSSCSDTGKDRHDFWGYAFGLPGSVTAVQGISVQLVASESNTSGAGPNMICVQVSGDAGATWSAAQTATLSSTSLATFNLGGTADLWGHGAWSLAQLSGTNFRIRITDVGTTTNNNKTFRLDYAGVSVTYLP